MIFFLPRNIPRDFRNPRVRHGKNTVAAAPSEFAREQVALIDPMRSAALQELHDLCDCLVGRQVHQRMHMVAIHLVDLHVDTLFRRVLG